MSCAVCGQTIPDEARFCPSCGAPVSASLATEERKMVTVLFADLVDSTGLGQRLDPERTRDLLGRFYDAVTEELRALRGQPEKFIGDAVMAVFGLPRVSEDDAVRAVRSGLAIRGRLRRLSAELGLDPPLQVRVGVESGEAATGIGPSGQLLVTGSVVNAAARLQSGAKPGEILAGETTRALTETSVSYAERRDVAAKGFDAALAGYRVEGLTVRSARRTIPFVGRDDELQILRQSFSRVRSAGRPMLFTLIGEPGIGKSRLVDEFVAGLDPADTVLTGLSHLSTDSATFAPAATMIREVAGVDDDDPPEKVWARLRDLVERTDLGAEGDRTVERLALLLGQAEERREESAFVQDVHAGFVAIVEALAAEQPLTLVFEDVHTLRPPMLDLVERVTARARPGSRQAFVLASGRPELLDERPGWGSGGANHVLLRLEPLSDGEAIALARQAGGGRIDDVEVATIAGRAGGNPFFIVESTGMLLRQQATGGTAHATGLLPPTVQAMIAARLDGLPATQREAARRLSVYLYSFDMAEADRVAGCVEDELNDLVDAEIIVREPGGSSPRWRFRHETLRDVAYASLPKRQRLTLHIAIADALLAERHFSWAADHLEAAAIASLDLDPAARELPDRAAEALANAGDRARRRMENRSAVDYYERALSLEQAQDGVRAARMLAGIGEARYWLGEYPAASETLARAVDLGTGLGDDWTLAHALRFLGDIAINVDADLDAADDLLARSLAAAESLDDPWAIARTLLFAGWVPWTRRNYEAAEPIWQRALQIAHDSRDRWAEVRALTSLSINRENMDDYDEATRLIERAQALADEMGDQFSVAVTTTQRGRLYEDVENWQEAISYFNRAIPIFADLGARWELADATAERGIVHRELGMLDDAEEDLRRAILISDELGERQLAGWTRRALAKVAERRGDVAEAQERLRRAEQEEARGPR